MIVSVELLADVREKPKDERDAETQQQTGNDREVERGVFAAMHDVTREAAEAEWEFTAEVEKSPEHGEEAAENKESAAEVAQRIHWNIIVEPHPQPASKRMHSKIASRCSSARKSISLA